VLVIKPDAVQAGKVDDIVEKVGWLSPNNGAIWQNLWCFNNYFLFSFQVEEQGYQVLAKEERQLTKEDAAEFYKQHEGSVSLLFNDLFINPFKLACTIYFIPCRSTLNS
jgi:hypothetical protein